MSRAAWIAGTLAALGGGGRRLLGRAATASALPDRLPAHGLDVRTHLGLGAAGTAASQPAPTGPVDLLPRSGREAVLLGEPQADGGRARLPRRSTPARTSASTTSRQQAAEAPAPSRAAKRVLYYRNPMGLPDTSPMPKKDSMGMDYIPVYEGEDDDGSTVKISPGQAAAHRRALGAGRAARRSRMPVRAPGTRPAGRAADLRRRRARARPSSRRSRTSRRAITSTRASPWSGSTRPRSPRPARSTSPSSNGGGRRSAVEGARQRLENLGVPADVDRRDRAHPQGAADDHLDGAARRRRARAQCRRRHDAPCRATCCSASPTISTVWVLADVPERDLAADRRGPAGDRPGPQPSRTAASPARSR